MCIRDRVTRKENFVKFVHVALEICKRTDADRHTDMLTALLCTLYWGRCKNFELRWRKIAGSEYDNKNLVWQTYEHQLNGEFSRTTRQTCIRKVKPQTCIKYSRYITCQSNTSKGRGHDRLPNWNPKNGRMLISQPSSRCLTNHSELCMSRLLNNQPRRIFYGRPM